MSSKYTYSIYLSSDLAKLKENIFLKIERVLSEAKVSEKVGLW